MKLIINGEEKTFQEKITITKILEELGIAQMVMACAINTEIVKKEHWDSCTPKEGDKVEFLEFVGGG